MFHSDATIRDYNGANDTATVELVGAGVIDTWIDGILIDASLNRALMTHGTRVTIAMPDAHRICEATVIGISSQYGNYTKSDTNKNRRIQSGRKSLSIGAGGSASGSVTYPTAYVDALNTQVYCQADNGYPTAISALTNVGFNVTVTGAPPNSVVYYSWHAEGNV